MFGLFQSRCQICGNLFKRNKYKWTIRDQTAWVCLSCNSRLERRASAAAFGGEVDWPEIRTSGGCGRMFGCLGKGVAIFLGLGVVASLMPYKDVAIPSILSKEVESPLPSAPDDGYSPSDSALSEISLVRVPLFREPLRAAQSVLSRGLSDTAPAKPAWRPSDPGWYGMAKVIAHKGGLSNVGDVDNDITCMHWSNVEDHVKWVRWTANVFNGAGSATTLSQYKEICLEYAHSLGCPVPDELFQNVNPTTGQKLETEDAVFKIKHRVYELGHGWEFTITTK